MSELLTATQSREAKKEHKTTQNGLMRAFAPLRIFLGVTGRCSFKQEKLPNGSYHFRMSFKHPMTVLWLIFNILITCTFVIMSIGFFQILRKFPDPLNERDKCNMSWENESMRRNFIPVLITYLWLFVSVASFIFVLLNQGDYVVFLNFLSKGMIVTEMDLSVGAKREAITTLLTFLGFFVSGTFIFLSGIMPIYQDYFLLVANVLSRAFISDFKDRIYLKERCYSTLAEYLAEVKNFEGRCDDISLLSIFSYNDKFKYANEPTSIRMARVGGFILHVYAFLSMRSFMYEFKFFSTALRTASYYFNRRLFNFFMGQKENKKDPRFIRLERKHLLKDHFIIVHLFNLAESAWGFHILAFYSIQFIVLILEIYWVISSAFLDSCDTHWTEFLHGQQSFCKPRAMTESDKLVVLNLSIYFAHNSFHIKDYKVWDNPCLQSGINYYHGPLIGILYLTASIYILFTVSGAASGAQYEAMEGFEILRRVGFMDIENRHQRNFIYQLWLSFSSEIVITGNGFFSMNKGLIVAFFGAIMAYLVILVQFRPGALTNVPCIPGECHGVNKSSSYQLPETCPDNYNTTSWEMYIWE